MDISFLSNGSLPNDPKESKKIKKTFSSFWLSQDDKLYRRSFRGLYMCCLHLDKVVKLLAELHEGIYGRHSGERSLAHRAMMHGFWWLSMQRDMAEYVKRCDRC